MKRILYGVVLLLAATSLVTGCAQQGRNTANQAKSTEKPVVAAKQTGPVYKGRVVGRSNKAKTLSIQVGKGKKAKTIMVKFDDQTKGLEFATKGHGVIVSYEKQGKDIYAKSIKAKLAKLPQGTSLIKYEELSSLINDNVDFELVDSRPAARYGQGHLPGAISIPVCEMQELVGLLPKHKDKLLIFYCGGPT